MMDGNSLVYKNVKVIKIKHGHSLQGFSDNQDGFEIDDEEYETEMVSDDGGSTAGAHSLKL